MYNIISKKNIAFGIFLFVNFLFVFKYLERYTKWAALIGLLICVFYSFLCKRKDLLKHLNKGMEFLLILLFITASLIIWKKIPVESLNVDRWSVITSFWDTYFSNQYAYYAKSNVGNPPGPMPFYFLLALPFYLIGELGMLPIIGILLFYGLMLLIKLDKTTRILLLLLVLSSFFNLWEIISRSNVFFNGTLILGSLIYILKQHRFTLKSLLVSAILIGLLISTRNVFVISYIICFLFLLRTKVINIKQLFILGILSIGVFSLTFVPIIINHMNDFTQINPFIVQSTFLIPFEYTLFFIFLAILSSFLCKSKTDVFFYNAVVLFISILIYLIYHIYNSGFYEAFTNSIVDISYFIFCIPFSLWVLTDNHKKSIFPSESHQ